MYENIILPHFRKQAKKYCKKHKKLKEAIKKELNNFDKRQNVCLGKNVYKMRVQSEGMSRGKNHSFRLLVMVVEIGKLLIPLTIFFKGNRDNITKKELNEHIEIALCEVENYDYSDW